MDTASDDVVLHMLSYLDFKSLATLGATCSKLRDLANRDKYWKKICAKTWLLNEKPSNSLELSWRQIFDQFYDDLGPYADVYAEMKSLWNRIFDFTDKVLPHVRRSLKPGLTKQEMLKEQESNDDLKHAPLDVLCSYRICNGQEDVDEFGTAVFGSLLRTGELRLLPLCETTIGFSAHFGADEQLHKCVCMSVAMNHGAEGFLMVALDWSTSEKSSETNKPNSDNVAVLDISSKLAPGCVVWTRQPDVYWYAWALADSWLTWLRQFVDRLLDYPVRMDRLFRVTSNAQGSTGPFDVHVRTGCMLPYCTASGQNFFEYNITISMRSDADERLSCRLVTRHWSIIDDNGFEEVVDGPGVVGEFPLMTPGATYNWTSCTHFKTSAGQMSGYFIMKKLYGDGGTIRIDCPVFHMRAPPLFVL